jgi:putative heme iron utilization protein
VPDPSVTAPTGGRLGDHTVPAPALAATERTLDAPPGLVGEPSDAERARTLVVESGTATLSTLAVDLPGTPFGSLVAHAPDEHGRPLLCLSDLAEHSRNLAADRRASVMVTEAGDGDPLARGRVTLLGDVTVLDGDERAAALERYRAVHPDAFYVEFSDFRAYRLEVGSARYVGGFGRMSWVDAGEYRGAEPDPLRPHRIGIIQHMNDDHADSLLAFCRVLAGRTDTVSARMLDVDRYGFSVLASTAEDSAGGGNGGGKAVRFGFDTPTGTPLAVRAAMIELVRRVRA